MTRATRCDPPRHDSDSDSVRYPIGNGRDAQKSLRTGIDSRGSSSDWESTGHSSAVVTRRGAEGRKAKAVKSLNKTLEAPKYADGGGRFPAREGYAEGVDYPVAVGSNPTCSIAPNSDEMLGLPWAHTKYRLRVGSSMVEGMDSALCPQYPCVGYRGGAHGLRNGTVRESGQPSRVGGPLGMSRFDSGPTHSGFKATQTVWRANEKRAQRSAVKWPRTSTGGLTGTKMAPKERSVMAARQKGRCGFESHPVHLRPPRMKCRGKTRRIQNIVCALKAQWRAMVWNTANRKPVSGKFHSEGGFKSHWVRALGMAQNCRWSGEPQSVIGSVRWVWLASYCFRSHCVNPSPWSVTRAPRWGFPSDSLKCNKRIA